MSWQELLQLAGVIGPIGGVVATGVWWCVQRHLRALWTRINKLQRQVEILTDEKAGLQRRCYKANESNLDQDRSIAALRVQLKKARKKEQFLRLRVESLHKEIQKLRGASLGPEVKALLENRVVELGRHLQEARTKIEMLRTRSRDAEALAEQREKQLSRLRQEKIQAEEAAQSSNSAGQKWSEILREPEERIGKLLDEIETLETQARQLEVELEEKTRCLDEASKEIVDLKTHIANLQAQIDGTVEQKGRIWERPFQAGSVRFEPLSARQMPILSILNLKGGVGKTSITANLGAMLGMQGARVLLIDLDYQRSLTLLCCSPKQIERLHQARQSLQYFLLDPQADAHRLLACIESVEAAEGCKIVINSDPLSGSEKGDNLEDAEMHLLADWLTNPASPDIRLILRNALHSPLIRERFDYVLLDCPPRLSTACINAVAASDFALVPVELDVTSAISAHNLLRKLRRLREENVLAELGVLGILANKVKIVNDRPTNAQAVVWDELRRPCQLAWGESVHLFSTMIRQSSAFAEAAARHQNGKSTRTLAVYAGDLNPIFENLVKEVRERIEHERQRPTAVSSKSDSSSGGERGVRANHSRT